MVSSHKFSVLSVFSVGILLLGHGFQVEAQTCALPASSSNNAAIDCSSASTPDANDGEKCTYTCDAGYTDTGSGEITCSGGSFDVPLCQDDCLGASPPSCTQLNTKCEAGACVCEDGFEGTDPATTACTDINECTDNSGICGTGGTCTNIDANYTCACDSGYTGGGDGAPCTDFDECTADPTICGVDATCANKAGSYTCTCGSGSTGGGDATLCADVDECAADSTICGTGGTCDNTAGSYTCTCDPGYSGGGDATACSANNLGDTCTTVDDCSLIGNATCDTSMCACDDGFKADGSSCLVGCTGANTCDVNAVCTGTATTQFNCTCNDGYTGNGTVCSATGGAIGMNNSGFSIFLPAFLMVLSAIFLC